MRLVSSSIWAETSASSSLRARGSSPTPTSACCRRSRFVRNDVRGVRSSWLASVTSWACRSREADSEAIIALNAAASRRSRRHRTTSIGVRVSVRATSSNAAVSDRTGVSPCVATSAPATAANERRRAPRAGPGPAPGRAASPRWGPATVRGRGPGRRPRGDGDDAEPARGGVDSAKRAGSTPRATANSWSPSAAVNPAALCPAATTWPLEDTTAICTSAAPTIQSASTGRPGPR